MTDTTRHIRITAEYKGGHASPLDIRASCSRDELGAIVTALTTEKRLPHLTRRYTIEADPWHAPPLPDADRWAAELPTQAQWEGV